MGKTESFIKKASGNVFVRNAVLAVAAILALGIAASILLNLFTRHNMTKEVPEFVGMDIDDARAAGRKASLRLEINDSLYMPSLPGGVVLEQSPSAGTEVKSGRRIFVTLNSFRQKMVDIPYVTGYSLRQARNILELAGLEIGSLVYSEDMATNNVIEQRYDGKTVNSGSKMQAEYGSGITLIVGWNPQSPNPVTPKLTGFSLREAKGRIWESGFNVGSVSFDEGITMLEEKDAKVYRQTPGPGGRVTPGGYISLMLTLDPEKVDKGSRESDRDAVRAAREEADRAIEEAIKEDLEQ